MLERQINSLGVQGIQMSHQIWWKIEMWVLVRPAAARRWCFFTNQENGLQVQKKGAKDIFSSMFLGTAYVYNNLPPRFLHLTSRQITYATWGTPNTLTKSQGRNENGHSVWKNTTVRWHRTRKNTYQNNIKEYHVVLQLEQTLKEIPLQHPTPTLRTNTIFSDLPSQHMRDPLFPLCNISQYPYLAVAVPFVALTLVLIQRYVSIAESWTPIAMLVDFPLSHQRLNSSILFHSRNKWYSLAPKWSIFLMRCLLELWELGGN